MNVLIAGGRYDRSSGGSKRDPLAAMLARAMLHRTDYRDNLVLINGGTPEDLERIAEEDPAAVPGGYDAIVWMPIVDDNDATTRNRLETLTSTVRGYRPDTVIVSAWRDYPVGPAGAPSLNDELTFLIDKMYADYALRIRTGPHETDYLTLYNEDHRQILDTYDTLHTADLSGLDPRMIRDAVLDTFAKTLLDVAADRRETLISLSRERESFQRDIVVLSAGKDGDPE